MPLSNEEINGFFARARTEEYPALGRRIIRYSEPILSERKENRDSAQAIYEAFDHVDWVLCHIGWKEERYDIERN